MEKMYAGGNFVSSNSLFTISNPYTGKKIDEIYLATAKEIDLSIRAAQLALTKMTELSSFEKYELLKFISEEIEREKNDFAQLIALESAKPIRYALIEVERSIETFRIAAEESKRLPKEYLSLDWTKSGKGKEAIVNYFPVGIIAGITPFNFPLNLVAHKVAPAIAAGCPIIIKPASSTPLTALKLAKIIDRSQLPKGAFSVLPCDRTTGNLLVTDERIALLSFTGSPEIGWEMKKHCGKKKIVLELGGNAGVYIDENADLDFALERCLMGAFAYSGQICIHTQRVFVHYKLFDRFLEEFTMRTKKLNSGDPLNTETDLSAMIDEKNALRIEAWVKEAIASGAKLCCGGKRSNSIYEPSVLTNTNSSMKINAEEVFGPIVCIESVKNLQEGVEKLNDTRFGLQAGIFSDSHTTIKYAFKQLQVGGVIINDVPTYRADHMPYGGIKDSGLGREGVKYAIQDYLEPRVLVF